MLLHLYSSTLAQRCLIIREPFYLKEKLVCLLRQGGKQYEESSRLQQKVAPCFRYLSIEDNNMAYKEQRQLTARALSSATLGAPLSPLSSRLSIDFLYFQCYETKQLQASSLPHPPLHRHIAQQLKSLEASTQLPLMQLHPPHQLKPRPLVTQGQLQYSRLVLSVVD